MEIKRVTENERIGDFINVEFSDYATDCGVSLNFEEFCFVAEDDDKIAGVITGRAYYNEVHIGDLIVGKAYRRDGVGSKLVRAVENAYKDKGYEKIALTTFGFQAPEFYKKLGYELEFVNNVEIIYDIANLNDIPELVRLRILYMIDDFGSITDEERAGMEKQLPGYFERELGKKLIAFVARAEGRLVAAAYLLIIEKPANPFFLNGLDSEVLSVYTEEGYRGKGICTNLMRNMIDYAAEHKISRIDLMATDEGYPIYKRLGFEDKVQKYKDMRLVVVNQ